MGNPHPRQFATKTSVHGPEVTQKMRNTRGPTAVLGKDEALPHGIKAGPAELRHATIAALTNEQEP
jgi:hypothetical protein